LNSSEKSREGGTIRKKKKTEIGVHRVIRNQRLVLTDDSNTINEIEKQFNKCKWHLNLVC